jgi:hypothetical protein
MIDNINSNFYTKDFLKFNNNTVTQNVPQKTDTGHSLQTDTVNLSKKQKTLISVGAGVSLLVGGIFAGKKIVNGLALRKVEKKFTEMLKDITIVQKEFKNIFLRSDITEEETVNMLNRYKNLEKMRLNKKVSKEDYIKAVFEEAKRNFGFEECKLIQLEYLSKGENKNLLGCASKWNNVVKINPSIKLKKVQNTLHHEMRHMKQFYFELNYDPKTFISDIDKTFSKIAKENNLSEREAKEVYDSIIEDKGKIFNLKSVSIDNIPAELREYVKKCLEASKNYVSGKKNYKQYYNNYIEQDARYAGRKICELFGLDKIGRIKESLMDKTYLIGEKIDFDMIK